MSNWPDPGFQKIDMTQNRSLLQHKDNFPGKSENNKTTQICLKYSLRCAEASVLERYMKNNRLSPKTMVQKKSESEKNLESESGDIPVDIGSTPWIISLAHRPAQQNRNHSPSKTSCSF